MPDAFHAPAASRGFLGVCEGARSLQTDHGHLVTHTHTHAHRVTQLVPVSLVLCIQVKGVHPCRVATHTHTHNTHAHTHTHARPRASKQSGLGEPWSLRSANKTQYAGYDHTCDTTCDQPRGATRIWYEGQFPGGRHPETSAQGVFENSPSEGLFIWESFPCQA